MKSLKGFYKNCLKRVLDVICCIFVIVVFWWVYLIIAFLVKIKLGSPIIYVANRVGKRDNITGEDYTFKLYKFRTMTNAKDENGKLLSDNERLTKFGRILRSASLDELPEVFNIIKGDMSVIGPRPLPVVYLPYYTETEKHRHDVRPGLSGYAQVHGRNSLSWNEKFSLDLYYVSKVSFIMDIKIIIQTVIKVLKRENIGQGEEMPVSLYDERVMKKN